MLLNLVAIVGEVSTVEIHFKLAAIKHAIDRKAVHPSRMHWAGELKQPILSALQP